MIIAFFFFPLYDVVVAVQRPVCNNIVISIILALLWPFLLATLVFNNKKKNPYKSVPNV
jgi:hypothetical protein